MTVKTIRTTTHRFRCDGCGRTVDSTTTSPPPGWSFNEATGHHLCPDPIPSENR